MSSACSRLACADHEPRIHCRDVPVARPRPALLCGCPRRPEGRIERSVETRHLRLGHDPRDRGRRGPGVRHLALPERRRVSGAHSRRCPHIACIAKERALRYARRGSLARLVHLHDIRDLWRKSYRDELRVVLVFSCTKSSEDARSFCSSRLTRHILKFRPPSTTHFPVLCQSCRTTICLCSPRIALKLVCSFRALVVEQRQRHKGVTFAW